MFYQANCLQHCKPNNKLCKIDDNCLIMCDNCYIYNEKVSKYSMAISLNSQALSFFQTLTGYSFYKMFEWVDIIRKNGFFTLFEIAQTNGSLIHSQGIEEQLSSLGIKAVQKYQCLIKNNRQFVLDNKNSQNLYHPQFLNDIYNLITQKWQLSSQLIINNLNQQIKQRNAQEKGHLPTFRIKQYYLNLIESYRQQLLTKLIKKLYYSKEDLKSIVQNNQNAAEQVFVNQMNQIIDYEIPYSIKQIESFQQIGERCHHYHNTVISISNQNQIQQKSLTNSAQLDIKEINLIKKEMELLKIQTITLQQQNKLLQSRNMILQRQKIELQTKIQKLLQQNKQNNDNDKNKIEVKALMNPNLFVRKIRIIK